MTPVRSIKPLFKSPQQEFKLIPIGGMGTVTKNMYVYQQGSEILIVDCGIGFPDATMLGVDLLIPDTSYLEQRKDQIVGMLLTHGHDDHIAGLPYILPKLGNIEIFASKLTKGFAQDRLKEFSVASNITEISDQPFDVGSFTVTPIKVTHSIPDARHFAIKTAAGIIYHGSDFKFDSHPVDGVTSQIDKISQLGNQGITCLLSDCLRSEKAGHSLSESLLAQSFEREIKGTQGRFIVTVMSSNVHRIQLAVDTALRHGRKMAFIGRSVESNVKTAIRLGFLKIPQTAIVNKKKILSHPPNKLAIVIAGSQGQEGSSLTRATSGEHQLLKIKPQDKVVIASDPIPGNENAVYSLIDELSRLGADVAYTDIDDDLHVSGHAYSEEQMQLLKLTRPKYLIPIGGAFRHMVHYKKLAEKAGYSPDKIFLLNDGQVVTFSQNQAKVTQTIPLKEIMVDGLGVGDVGSMVLKDRQVMATEGMVVVVVPLSKHTQNLSGRLQIISRGFVFMKQSQKLVNELESQAKQVINQNKGQVKDWGKFKANMQQKLEKVISKKLNRNPLIITAIVEI